MDSISVVAFSLAFSTPMLASKANYYITVNQGGVRPKHGEYISQIEMFVWIKGRQYLLVIDLTASILTDNETHLFLYNFYYTGFWAWHSKSDPTSYTCLSQLYPYKSPSPNLSQAFTVQPLLRPLSWTSRTPAHINSYENPSHPKAHFCQPHPPPPET